MAKELKRGSGKDNKEKRSDSPKGRDSKKGKKPSFERYRDESRPSDFGSSAPKRSTSSYGESKRKPFGDKPGFRKKLDEHTEDEKPAFRKKRDDDFEEKKPAFNREKREDKPAFGREKKSGFGDKKRKPFGDKEKPAFRKKRDDDNEERTSYKKNHDDDFYESKPSFVRASDIKNFDYESEFQAKKSGRSDYGDKRAALEKAASRDEKAKDENYSRPYKKRSFDKSAPGKRSSKPTAKTSGLEGIRLNKYISNAGICSRREADDLIASGVVQVNGKIITEMGFRVKPADIIKYGGQTLKKERLVYLILNKPKDYITTVDDPQQRRTVQELVQGACRERIYPVGRLDRATTGLLMFTNDGDLTKKLTHPRYGVRKIYHVELDKPLKRSDMDKISEGLELEDGEIKVDEITYTGDGKDKASVGVELHSGKNRIVRRIFEHMGYNVRKLDRVMFGPLTKKDMPRGRWRFLTDQEVGMLKMISGD